MSGILCGRCGNRTAPNSTYCPHCRWTLFVDAPENDANSVPVIDVELRRGNTGFLAKRRQESHRVHLDKNYRAAIDGRTAEFEAQLESDPSDLNAMRMLGVLALIDHSFERANALLERAHEINPNDLEVKVNYGIALAQRGQFQPAIDVLQDARKQWPNLPLVVFNLLLVALQAHRPQIALEAADALERMWLANPAIAPDYHDETMTARGLALLEMGRPTEARAALDAAARHMVSGMPQSARMAPVPAAAAVTAAGGGAAGGGAPPGPEDDPDNAIQLVEGQGEDNGYFDTPVSEDGAQIEGKGAEADLLNNLALAEVAAGDIERAINRLAAALRIEPGHARVRNNLGVLAYQQGQLQLALKYLSSARQIEDAMEQPEVATINNMGVVYSILGRLDESMEHFERAGKSDHAEFEVFYNLGRAYIEHGRPEEGVQYLRNAFAINPTHTDLHTVLGAAYLLRGKAALLPEALKHLKRALQINARHRVALADLAMTMLEMGDQTTAVQIIRQALKINTQSPETTFLAALITMQHGDEHHWAQASLQFGSVLDTRPDLISSLYNASLCQYLMGFRDTAAQQLEEVTGRDASFAPAYYMIGVGHAVAERYNEALLAWQKAVAYEPGNPDLQANMAFVYYTRADYKKAIKCYMQAHHLIPNNAQILAALGLCFARDNNLNQAIAAFEHSLRLDPHSPVTHSNLGLAHYMHKNVEQAVEHWRIVSQLDSGYASRRGEEQQKNYDDSIVSLAPLNWKARIVKMAPFLPRPHTKLMPGYNAKAYRPAMSDPSLEQFRELRKELEHAERINAWMHLRN